MEMLCFNGAFSQLTNSKHGAFEVQGPGANYLDPESDLALQLGSPGPAVKAELLTHDIREYYL